MKTLTRQKAEKIAVMARFYDVAWLLGMGFYAVAYSRSDIRLQGESTALGFRVVAGWRESGYHEFAGKKCVFRQITAPGSPPVVIVVETRKENAK